MMKHTREQFFEFMRSEIVVGIQHGHDFALRNGMRRISGRRATGTDFPRGGEANSWIGNASRTQYFCIVDSIVTSDYPFPVGIGLSKNRASGPNECRRRSEGSGIYGYLYHLLAGHPKRGIL